MMSAKGLYIKDIKPNSSISGVFLVKEKNLALTRNGLPYLALSLMDKTGNIEARVWEKSEELNLLFRKGDYITIEAQAESFRDQTQLNVSHVELCKTETVNATDFLPSSLQDTEEMWRELKKMARQVKNQYLAQLLRNFLNDDSFTASFKTAPAAKRMHHAYLSGLLEHTLSVTKLVCSICSSYSEVDKNLLITGSILHDIGKIKEFTYPPQFNYFDYTDEGRLVGHLVIGAQMVQEKMDAIRNFPEEMAVLLEHLVLSHHGEYQYGSPKRPKTIEAFILHFADDLDAKINAINCLKMNRADTLTNWSGFFHPLERYIYLGGGITYSPETSEMEIEPALENKNSSDSVPLAGENYSLIDRLDFGKKG